MDTSYTLTAIAIMAIVNYLTRALPFLFFKNRKPPAAITLLEEYFPAIIMTILIFYSLKSVKITPPLYGSYELIAVIGAVTLHLIFKNYLLSIVDSTLLYMASVQHWF